MLPQVRNNQNNGAVEANWAKLTVRVVPRSSRSEIIGEHDGALKIKLTSPPVDGAANAELIALIAKKLGVPRSNVEITSGESSKTKQLRITGVTASQIRSLLDG
ncbi:MAG: DUF167 domain-containing protein [Acidobacteriota bacterium]